LQQRTGLPSLSGNEAVDSEAVNLMFGAADPVDVALLKARYIAAFEYYLALATKLAELTESGRAPLVQLLEESLVAETRDEMIRRSIAKRDQAGLDTVRKRRLNHRRRIA
jgi:hypothetical protein